MYSRVLVAASRLSAPQVYRGHTAGIQSFIMLCRLILLYSNISVLACLILVYRNIHVFTCAFGGRTVERAAGIPQYCYQLLLMFIKNSKKVYSRAPLARQKG